MGEENGKRRRGHRRGRGRDRPSGMPAGEKPDENQPEVAEESDAPGVLPSRFSFRFWRRGSREEERHRREREEGPAAEAFPDVSPLAFWRRGRARTYREQPMPKQTLKRTLRRVGGLDFPPWAPVLVIIAVVFGILGALFFVRGATGAPRIGDHWHATYQIVICGERQPNVPTFEAAAGSPGTHGDGVFHQHPFSPEGEGAGSNLRSFFKEGGGKLTGSEIRIPATRETYKDGDLCDDGRPGKCA